MNRSVYVKTLILIVVTVFSISLGAIFYFMGTLSRLQDQQVQKKARELADIVSINIDIDALDSYKAKVDAAYNAAEGRVSNDHMGQADHEAYVRSLSFLKDEPEFKELYDPLRELLSVADVDCFYLCYLDEPTKTMVYLVDVGDNNICEPGSFDYLKGEDLLAINDPNRSIVASVTDNDIYGDIVGSAEPIYDKVGNVVAYVGVDISMESITRQLNRMLINTILAMLVLGLLLTAASLRISGRMMVRPLESHQELLQESENLKKENFTLSKKAIAAERIAELKGSISSLLDHMPAITYSKEIDTGKYLACNQAFADYTNKKSPAQIIGLTDEELFESELADHFLESDGMALSMGVPYVFREEVIDQHGRTRYLKTTKLKFTDASGRRCILGMSEDISELVQAQKETEKTRDAYNQAVSQRITYSRIASALSADYSFLYYVDIRDDTFTEYSPKKGQSDISVVRKDVDFFEQSAHDALEIIYVEDQLRFLKSFTKENILDAIEKQGRYQIEYRMIMGGEPVYYRLKGMRLEDDDDHIIIGVNDVDIMMKERAVLERMREEQATYQRIAALSGEFICIYTVDPETEQFREYSTSHSYASISLPAEGENFFEKTRVETDMVIYDEDRDRCLEALDKDNIINEIYRSGIFDIKYRLVIEGKPTYVELRAALIEEADGPKLIVGVTNIDAKERQNLQYEENLATAFAKANYDAMTGVKNKHAYVELEKELNDQIVAGKADFAVVVCDVNELKRVNDTLGHKAGDDLIKSAANIICETFRGSEVFRVGGDEFTVIVMDDALVDLETMTKKLVAISVENNNKGGVVVASGMSRYIPMDPDVVHVFERADSAMYINKQWLKNNKA
ncbi:MAG: diguanylate cyclase [Lachnospiraceae bacterium]|nr:diguanylate cyclase [Lachnospiraceae bacterium]